MSDDNQFSGKTVPKPKKKVIERLEVDPKKREAMDAACSQVEKKFGKGSVMDMGTTGALVKVDTFPSGSLLLDKALGVGGYPRGRIMEIFGPESCLAADTFIQYNVCTGDGRRMNHKGGTIQRLWKRFHGKSSLGNGRGKYLRPESVGAKFTVPCLNEEDRIFHNSIVDVVDTGFQECFELQTLGGYSITATAEHKFFTGQKWVTLEELTPGDTLLIHNNIPFRRSGVQEIDPTIRKNERAYWFVKHHPVAGEKIVNAKISRSDPSLKKMYPYKRLARSRGVIEASMNGMTVEEYRNRLMDGNLEGMVFLDREDHVHHLDENVMNDDLGNLVVISASEHGHVHAIERHNNLRFTAVEDVVCSVAPVGSKQTYDIKMASPFNNYVANNFVVHNSGKTTLALHAIAEIQKRGEFACFIDAEHALDASYAEVLGVDMGMLRLSQPDYGEQGLEIADIMVRSGGFGLVVIDSVAALTPKAELDGDMGESHIGLQARLMGQATRKLAALASQTKTTILFVNQIREKIGVMFGCFQYDARVVLADGTTEKIGKIVNQKMPVEVLSFDQKIGKCEPRMVVGWHDNGNADYFLQFEVEKCGGNGVSRFGVTPNHMIFTPSGDRPAGELEVGDEVWGKGLIQFTPLQRQVAIGSILGDGSLRKVSNHNVQLRIGHGVQQIDYARWKAELFGDTVRWSGNTGDDGWGFDTRPSVDLFSLRAGCYYWDNKRMISKELLEELNLLGVAIWYMDDACFSGTYERWGCGKVEISMKSYREDEMKMVAKRLVELGLPEATVTSQGRLLWSGQRTHDLQQALAPFIHPIMEYKLYPDFRGMFQEYDDVERVDCFEMIPVPITNIYVKPKTRSMRRFDLTVEGHHTYIVDGVGVHNSPETTPGGNALKFYSTIRLDIRRIGKIKEGDNIVGNQTRVKVVKNKVAPPFQQAEFDIIWGHGIHHVGEVLDLAVEHDLVTKKGAFYSYNEINIGQGRAKAISTLEEKPEIIVELEKAVLEKMKGS